MNLKQTGLAKYLDTLINPGILEGEVPVTEENPEKRGRGRCRIGGNFPFLWFKFVFPGLSYTVTGKTEAVKKKIRENFADAHASFVCGDICRERMREPERKSRLVAWKNESRRDHFIIFSMGGYTDELRAAVKAGKDPLLKRGTPAL